MNKYILPSILTVVVLVIVVVSIFFIIKNNKSENFVGAVNYTANISVPSDITHNGVKYDSIVSPTIPADAQIDVLPDESSFLITEKSGNINTVDVKHISDSFNYLYNMVNVNRQKVDLLANVVSQKMKGLDTQALDELKTLTQTLKTDVDNLKITSVDKTKDIKITKSVSGNMFPDKTLFADDAGPTTTVAAFGKIQDHPADNKLRIVQ